MTNDDTVRASWSRCCEARRGWRGAETPCPEGWAFGGDPATADRLGGLPAVGVKTATSSALWEDEHDGRLLPRAGDLGIVLDGRGRPLGLVETTDVRVLRFDEVPADHAFAEGEGGRSLASWRAAHWAYFERFLPRVDRAPAPDMPVVCESFRVLFVA